MAKHKSSRGELSVQTPMHRMTTMILSALVTTLALVAPALAGQFPIVDGVIGGVSETAQNNAFGERFTAAQSTGRSNETIGKLRYKENSGVCGAFLYAYHIRSG
jgi:hypothetical protein